MKSKIIKRFAGVLAFLMLATQISIPVFAEDGVVADDFEFSPNTDSAEVIEGSEGSGVPVSGDGQSDPLPNEEVTGLSEDVNVNNVVGVVSEDVENAVGTAVEGLVNQAVGEVLAILEDESTDEVVESLEAINDDIEAEISRLGMEAISNPLLKAEIAKRIEHLQDLRIRIKIRALKAHENAIQQISRIKNVPAVYEIRWGNLLGKRQSCDLAPLRLRNALTAGEMPEECEVNKVEYTGKISVDKGELIIRKKVLFEENDEVVTESGSAIGFNSVIAGHWDGLVVQYVPPTDDTEAKSAVNVTVSIGELDETYVGNEVLGRKKIGNDHMIEFRHLGKILPTLTKANQDKFIQSKLKIQGTVSSLRSKLDRIRLLKNVGSGADELEDVVDEAGEYNFDDTTAEEVEDAISTVVDSLGVDVTPADITAKARILRAKLQAAKQKAVNLKFAQKLIPFKDTDDDQWYTNYVSTVKGYGIISGYKDVAGNDLGEFRPANNITVAEILKIGLETAGKGAVNGSPSLTTATNHWAKGYVKRAEELGANLVEGSVDLNRPATRGEVIRLMLEALGIEPDAITSTDFSDVPRLHEHALFIQYAKELDIISGDAGKTTFRPDAPINRAEAAKISSQIMNIIIGGWDS